MTSSSDWVSISTPYLRSRSPGVQDAWAEEAAQSGRAGGQQLREVAEVVPPSSVAEALNIQAGEVVVVRRRIMSGEKYEAAPSRYDPKLGNRPHRVREDISARAPSAEERKLLTLGQHEWVLVLSRLMTTDDGLAIEASVMTMTAQGRHLRYQLTA